jgi:DNA-binding MarR family transcriptional regulator/GNAT superfamily N-acetyltransferase
MQYQPIIDVLIVFCQANEAQHSTFSGHQPDRYLIDRQLPMITPPPESARRAGHPAKFIDDYLSYLLSRAGHVVYREFHATVHAAGLSSLEWRVLATLSDSDGLTIGDLAREVLTQQPTLTKLIQRMEKAGWVRRGADLLDARRTLVFETAQGCSAVASLLKQAKNHESQLLSGFGARDVTALKKILRALISRDNESRQSTSPRGTPVDVIPSKKQAVERAVVLRRPQPGDMGWVVQQHGEIYAREYGWNAEFEALVADIMAKCLRHWQPEWERCWMAEVDGQRVGSVFVVRKSKTVAQLRMLILTSDARGLGLGARLTDECIAFARSKGYKKMTLWTNSCLAAARGIYVKRAFKLVTSEAYDGFGQTGLVSETWELIL